jgi:lysophospholipase L1-like esterase
VAEFDQATVDPATGNMKAEFVPNSQITQLPWDYLHPNHAGYNAMGLAVDIRPFAPKGHR